MISLAPQLQSSRARFLISGSDSDVVQIHYWSTARVGNWHKPVCCWWFREYRYCHIKLQAWGPSWSLWSDWRNLSLADWLLLFVILQTMAALENNNPGENKQRKWVKIIENYPQDSQMFSGDKSLDKLKLSNSKVLQRQRSVEVGRAGKSNIKHQWDICFRESLLSALPNLFGNPT